MKANIDVSYARIAEIDPDKAIDVADKCRELIMSEYSDVEIPEMAYVLHVLVKTFEDASGVKVDSVSKLFEIEDERVEKK